MVVIGPVMYVDAAMSVCLDVIMSLVEIRQFFVVMTVPTRVSIAGIVVEIAKVIFS